MTILRSLLCFYLNKNSYNNFIHISYFLLANGNINNGIRDALEDTLQMIANLFENHCPASIAQQFLEISSGGEFPQKSMPKLRKIVLIRKHK